MTEVEAVTTYVTSLTREQLAELRQYLEAKGYAFRRAKYSHFAASSNNVSLTAYTNGKVLVQGKGTADFVRYYLEPQLLKEIKFGYEYLLNENLSIEERIGVDESGKVRLSRKALLPKPEGAPETPPSGGDRGPRGPGRPGRPGSRSGGKTPSRSRRR